MHAEGAPDPEQVGAVWRLPGIPVLRPAPEGINNRSWYVLAGDARYVLRVYHYSADPARIVREHAVLRSLGAFPLSFRVPVPAPAFEGETVVMLRIEGRDCLAALFPLIPGHRPERGDLEATRAAGAALGELDAAMARLDLPPALAGEPAPETLLDDVHPAVPDFRALPDHLSLDVDRRTGLVRLLTIVAEEAPGLYQSMPRQWIHADFGAANLLIDAGVIAGVLDFEFAHVDLRAVDPAWALNFFAFDAEKRADLELLDAFGGGYTRSVSLSEVERRALPRLIRLCRAVVAVHWCGRYLEGSASRETALGNIDAVLRQDAWLEAYGNRVAECALRW